MHSTGARAHWLTGSPIPGFPLAFPPFPPYTSSRMNGKDRRYLRGQAHNLNPVVIIGKGGLTDAVVRQVDGALTDHELIKVRLSAECPVDRDGAGEMLAMRTGAELAGHIGRVLILYRPHPETPHIVLPSAGAAPAEP